LCEKLVQTPSYRNMKGGKGNIASAAGVSIAAVIPGRKEIRLVLASDWRAARDREEPPLFLAFDNRRNGQVDPNILVLEALRLEVERRLSVRKNPEYGLSLLKDENGMLTDYRFNGRTELVSDYVPPKCTSFVWQNAGGGFEGDEHGPLSQLRYRFIEGGGSSLATREMRTSYADQSEKIIFLFKTKQEPFLSEGKSGIIAWGRTVGPLTRAKEFKVDAGRSYDQCTFASNSAKKDATYGENVAGVQVRWRLFLIKRITLETSKTRST
jgi:hypothetical protein